MLFSFLLKLYKPMDMTESEPEECSFPNCTLAPENGLTLLSTLKATTRPDSKQLDNSASFNCTPKAG